MNHIRSLQPIAIGKQLALGAVDLWCFYYEALTDPSLLTAYDALMTKEERVRHRRLLSERDRRRFLATRALVRTVLSHYADVAPTSWRFAESERGKPYLSGPPGAPRIEFNLTNTRGLVACAVSLVPQIGVDAEWVGRPSEAISIAELYFSPSEVRALRTLKPDDQREQFFRYWTLKESYVKARGIGLALPLDQFSFRFEDGDEIRVAFGSQIVDDPRNWRFALLRGSAHIVAVGANTGGAPLSVCASSYVPLRGVLPFEANW